jgi:PAS domain S-box-containing protein
MLDTDFGVDGTKPMLVEHEVFCEVFGASPIGIALESLEGQPFFVNPALCSMLGFSEEEMCGKHCVQFSPPDDAERDWALFEQLRGGSIESYQLEKRYFRKDGSLFWGRLSVSLFNFRGDRLVLALVEDITDKKAGQDELQQSEASLQKLVGELRSRTDQLRRLASELTLAEQHVKERVAKTLHDSLQQLLFSAGLQLDRALKRIGTSAPDASAVIARARTDIEQATEAIRTLSLDLYPAVLHEDGLPVALPWLAAQMEEQYGLTVDLSIDEKADLNRKDLRALVFECVRELLFNIVKHSKVDRARLSLALTEDEVRITVADEGVGFDPSATFARGGVHTPGLGLFSIRERLALMGGRLEISSAPGRGARFVIFASRTRASAESAAGVGELPLSVTGYPSPPNSETGAPTGRALRIVVADDHQVVRQGIRDVLAEWPQFRVVGEAADGLEAVAQARALHPDVMLMDISMPKIDGLEATQRIVAELPFIKIFALSVREPADGLRAIERAGGVGYFSKSGSLQTLVERLLALQRSELSLG